ncbi:hypothetical protein KC19_3G142000 [Ceratodon purpureus]|uniref:DUF7748 domain-containing protein n=1 Tax=Ceratodon purpureus TaxID=3225 RepID=A0A8T0IKF6_CERPU|nr:hypothetical protein KC19_3G142000 [Ceratodon purpureus]
MVRVSTILENGTSSPFEVRSESSCGVHTVLKTLGPQETFRLERSTSDTYLQHWVVMGSAVVLSFSSDELVDNDKITIVSDGSIYKKVVNARPLRSASLPSRRSSYVQPEGAVGSSHRSSASKPPARGFRKFLSSLIGRGSDAPAEESDAQPDLEPDDPSDVHRPHRLHSLP